MDPNSQNRENSFRARVLEIVRTIPIGTTRTYKQVAMLAGRPRAYRAVGTILHHAWQADQGRIIPCHRVIRSDGSWGGYAGGREEKIVKLQTEGIIC